MSQQLGLIRIQLEAEVKLRISLEDKLKMVGERVDSMQNELKSTARRESYFRNIALRYSQGVSQMAPILNKLQADPGITDEGFL